MKTLIVLFLALSPMLLVSQESINASSAATTDGQYLTGTLKLIGYCKTDDTLTVYWKVYPIFKTKVSSSFDIDLFFSVYERDELRFELQKPGSTKLVAIIKSLEDEEQLREYTMGSSK